MSRCIPVPQPPPEQARLGMGFWNDNPERAYSTLRKMGIRWLRTDAGWSWIEPKQGVGQKVSIALIDPIFSIVVEKHIVEDMDKPFNTVEKEDSSMYTGQTKVQTEGVNGTQRVTEKVKYVNGEAQPAVITNVTTISEPVDKVVLKGTKSYGYGSSYTGGGTPAVTSGVWGWPTISPYIITSYYGYRWGRLHAGIDISGCGFGYPI